MKYTNRKLIDTALFSLVVGVFTVLYAVLFEGHDADFNWYCVLGKDIVSGHPNFHGADAHSWIAQERGYSEIQHSWLGTVIVYGISCLFKPFDMAVVAFIFITATMCAAICKAVFLNKLHTRPLLHLIASVVVAYVVVDSTFLARTRSFDCLFFVLAYCFMQGHQKRIWKIIVLSVISLLWANIHGSSILLYFAFLFLFFVLNRIPDFVFGAISHKQDKFESNTMLIAFVISIMVGLINPYGIRLYGYALFNNTPYVKEGIMEWNAAGLLCPQVLICLIAFCIYFVVLKKNITLKKLFPIVMLLGMTGMHIRMGMYLYITLLPMIMDIVQEANDNLSSSKLLAHRASNRIPTILVCAVCSFLTVVEAATALKSYTYYSVSEELIAYLHAKDYRRAYNDYDVGAYLIFNGLPDFVDARADFYDEETLVGARQFANASFEKQGDMQKFMDTFQFDAIILNQNSAVTIDYLLCNDWVIDYEDERENKGFNYVVLIPKQS